jgi:hypothetical protein
VSAVIERFAEALDHLSEHATDPAEKLSASVRYTLLRARQDPDWGRFLVRTSLTGNSMNSGLGRYFMRDLKSGLASGRFKADDVPMTYVALGGAVLAALSTEVEFGPSSGRRRAGTNPLGAEAKDVAERTAAVLLRLLGIGKREAESIAYRPLPEITLPPNPLDPH